VATPQREQLSDQQLVEAANRGDAQAFEMLYERYRDWVHALALRFTRDHALAQDVTQDTFIYLLRKFPGFQLSAQLKTFLYPVVRHNVWAHARSRDVQAATRPLAEHLEEIPASAGGPPSSEQLRELHRAVEQLDHGQREVIILRFVEDLSLQDIALAMEIPLGTVKSRLHHALSSLRENEKLRNFFQDS
jgi:RNA polymerase sigma-70 factor (ECF subfamily)